MTTTPDNTATTWRDLADQLTPDQIAGIENMERKFTAAGITDDPRTREALIDFARDYSESNLIDTAYADIPLPAGARDGSGWEKNLQRDGWSRTLVWASFGDREMSVDIDGEQECDGTYTRHITAWLEEDGARFTSAGARRLAALLIDAADELDRLRIDT